MWLWIVLIYFVGASYTVRRTVLQNREYGQQLLKGCRLCSADGARYYCSKHAPEILKSRKRRVWVPLLWPGVLAVSLWWKMLFPRGVRTKTEIASAREKALEAKNKALAEKLQRQAEEIKQLSTAAGLYVPEGL